MKDLAEEAILRLQEKNLVKTSGLSSRSTRREFVAAVGSIALPLVAALSIGEQRAYALFCGFQGRTVPDACATSETAAPTTTTASGTKAATATTTTTTATGTKAEALKNSASDRGKVLLFGVSG